MTLVIKKIDEQKLREFKAEAIRRGLTLGQALEEAIDLWISVKDRILVESDINNMVYNEIKNDLEKYVGKYIVIVKGKFLGSFATLDEVAKVLKKYHGSHGIVLHVGYDVRPKGALEWLGGSIELKTA